MPRTRATIKTKKRSICSPNSALNTTGNRRNYEPHRQHGCCGDAVFSPLDPAALAFLAAGGVLAKTSLPSCTRRISALDLPNRAAAPFRAPKPTFSYALLLLRHIRVGINAALDLGEPLLMVQDHFGHFDNPPHHDGRNWYQPNAEIHDGLHYADASLSSRARAPAPHFWWS